MITIKEALPAKTNKTIVLKSRATDEYFEPSKESLSLYLNRPVYKTRETDTHLVIEIDHI